MLSILLPSIRTDKLPRVYESIQTNFNKEFELIVVGPYNLPESINKSNVKFIKDFGSPTRCLQLGLLQAQYEYIKWFSDDSWYVNNSLTICVDQLLKKDKEKYIVWCKYTEGDNPSRGMWSDEYYTIGHGIFSGLYVDPSWVLLNFAIMQTSYLESLGGFDCRFDTTIFSVTDLAVRAQRDAAILDSINIMACHSEHMEGLSGDHAPVALAFEQNDVPLYNQIYNNENANNRINIDINNWKSSPEVWQRRFN